MPCPSHPLHPAPLSPHPTPPALHIRAGGGHGAAAAGAKHDAQPETRRQVPRRAARVNAKRRACALRRTLAPPSSCPRTGPRVLSPSNPRGKGASFSTASLSRPRGPPPARPCQAHCVSAPGLLRLQRFVPPLLPCSPPAPSVPNLHWAWEARTRSCCAHCQGFAAAPHGAAFPSAAGLLKGPRAAPLPSAAHTTMGTHALTRESLSEPMGMSAPPEPLC